VVHPFRRPATACWLALAGVAAVAVVPAGRPSLAQAPAMSPELAAVPPDAAFFVHLNGPALWNSPLVKSLRAADAKAFAEMSAGAKEVFGVTPDAVRGATLVFTTVKDPSDTQKVLIHLSFAGPVDQAKFREGVEKAVGKGPPVKVVFPSPPEAVVLVGLDAPPKPAARGPLSDALRAAASGKYAAVFGTTLASLPDEIRGDNLPEFVRPFQPILRAESIVGTLDAAKDLTFDVRVKAGTPAQAIEAEKALAALGKLLGEGLAEGIKETDREKGLKDVSAVLKGFDAGLKGARFGVEKTEARATVTVPGTLPFGPAFTAGVAKVRDAAAAARSANNLKQIALALHNYESGNGALPPAAVCDRGGKPMLSWRVLILPYIEEEALYKQFKLDEPWDSEHNKKLLAKMPKVYGLPDKGKPGDTATHYRVFVGNGAGFDYVRGGRFTEITDGTSNTVMVVTAAAAVPWTKPDELPFDPDKDMTKLLGAVVNGKVQVGMFDGSVRSLNKIPDKKTLAAMITKAGGEVYSFDD
jgi:hypothetical protein